MCHAYKDGAQDNMLDREPEWCKKAHRQQGMSLKDYVLLPACARSSVG